MSYIHYFNPGHEMAILNGSDNYTPPLNVQRMMRDLSFLPIWYAEAGDYVYTDVNKAPFLLPEFLGELPSCISKFGLSVLKNNNQSLRARPWGLSPQSCALFQKLTQKGLPIIAPYWKEQYRILTSRQTARVCFEKLKELLPQSDLPETPFFCFSLEDAQRYIKEHESTNFIIKSPFSSSGRGVFMLKNGLNQNERQWMLGILKRQLTFSIEPLLDKIMDFAMEFYSDGKGNVHYKGLSVFSTVHQSSYTGNLLGSPSFLENQLKQYGVLQKCLKYKKYLKIVLEQIFGSEYEGYLGVDMMIYRNYIDNSLQIHPCVEINMRYTMGLVSLQISKQLLAPQSIGRFMLTFNSSTGEALRNHDEMMKQYPLKIEKNKILSGYFSLCPVEVETAYRAFILIEEPK